MKSRLRHPIRAAREPFGKAGLIVAIVALVAAIGGTAFAAAKLNSTQKKEVTKIAKKYAGKPGANGATGPAGATGSAGASGGKGEKGDQGNQGEKGDQGDQGNPGASVISHHLNPGEDVNCEEGGSKFEAGASTTYACNGKEGARGPEGSPWTNLGVLPSGQSEYGVWAFNADGETVGPPTEPSTDHAPISFTIPLSGSPEPHYVTTAEWERGSPPAACPSNPEAGPIKAVPQSGELGGAGEKDGTLCVYEDSAESAASFAQLIRFENPAGFEAGHNLTGAGRYGTVLAFENKSENSHGSGLWVLTAP